MLNKLRNFSKGKLAGVLVGIIIIPFVFWGMGSVFSGGNTNSIAKINTMLARGLKTTGQVPEKLIPAYRRRQNQYQSDVIEIKDTVKILDEDLKRARKEAKASGQNPDDITLVIFKKNNNTGSAQA